MLWISGINEAEGRLRPMFALSSEVTEKHRDSFRCYFSPNSRTREKKCGAAWRWNSGGIRKEIRARGHRSLVCLETVHTDQP